VYLREGTYYEAEYFAAQLERRKQSFANYQNLGFILLDEGLEFQELLFRKRERVVN